MVRHRSNLDYFVLTATLIFAFTISGCGSSNIRGLIGADTGKFILVQSRVIETTRNDSVAAEVTTTPRYSKIASQIKSVAISAPSSCANQAASSATGSAESKGAIVMTRCGVEMAEIERALVRQGFTVYSWNMVNNTIIAQKTENAPAVAKQLGAQVLFQVNSLERVTVTPGRDARIERSFLESNASGESLNPLELDERLINEIKSVIGQDEAKRLPSAKRLGAMLDINAVDSETGQTLWFYRWSKHEETSKYIFASYLLKCWDQWARTSCERRSVVGEEQGRDSKSKLFAPRKRSSEEETVSTDPRPASIQDAIYFGLLRDVTTDFVQRFSSGQ